MALQAAQDQINDLDQALQLMTDTGTDLLLLNDIDRLVTIAQQQLKLDGNVANAIISLEVAQARLARANRPALASLQQSINGDVDRLRAVIMVDLPELSSRLDRLY
ncbi:MAG TPA: uroporphyrinogen-III C-methyltransferase, partial [Castellaniella sp.]|nr:uroporphyrinogen-III C-methyltransferase [Castellaniella sp.]